MENISKQWIIERYGKYHNYLKLLGEYPSYYVPTIGELKLERKAFQACYKDMKRLDCDVNVIMYLCYLSTAYFLGEWEKKIEALKADERCRLMFLRLDATCGENRSDLQNATRFFLNYPDIVFSSPIVGKYREEYFDWMKIDGWDSCFDVALAERFYFHHALDSIPVTNRAKEVAEGIWTSGEYKENLGYLNIHERLFGTNKKQ